MDSNQSQNVFSVYISNYLCDLRITVGCKTSNLIVLSDWKQREKYFCCDDNSFPEV